MVMRIVQSDISNSTRWFWSRYSSISRALRLTAEQTHKWKLDKSTSLEQCIKNMVMFIGWVPVSTLSIKSSNPGIGSPIIPGSLRLCLSSKYSFCSDVQTSFHLRARMEVATTFFVGRYDRMWQRTESGKALILYALTSVYFGINLFDFRTLNAEWLMIKVVSQPGMEGDVHYWNNRVWIS